MIGIELYASGDGAKALAACPVTRGPLVSLCCFDKHYVWCGPDDAGQYIVPTRWLPDEDALAVIRDHFRELLAANGVWIRVDTHMYGWRIGLYGAKLYATYDEALIAAVLAVFRQEGAV